MSNDLSRYRRSTQTGLIVASRSAYRDDIHKVFPVEKYYVTYPQDSLMGSRFDEILFLYRPSFEKYGIEDKNAERWIVESVMCRLKPNGRVLYLV